MTKRTEKANPVNDTQGILEVLQVQQLFVKNALAVSQLKRFHILTTLQILDYSGKKSTSLSITLTTQNPLVNEYRPLRSQIGFIRSDKNKNYGE